MLLATTRFQQTCWIVKESYCLERWQCLKALAKSAKYTNTRSFVFDFFTSLFKYSRFRQSRAVLLGTASKYSHSDSSHQGAAANTGHPVATAHLIVDQPVRGKGLAQLSWAALNRKNKHSYSTKTFYWYYICLLIGK